jgi:hypothetical protein
VQDNPQGRASIEDAVSAYYSLLSEDEVIEQAEWSEFALDEFPREA